MFHRFPVPTFKAQSAQPLSLVSPSAALRKTLRPGLTLAGQAFAFVVGLFVVVVLCGTASAQTLAPSWYQQSPASNPGTRYIHAMTYDAGHQQVVLFGGYGSSGYLNDTWLWNGTNWNQANPVTLPPTRAAHAMVYDPVHGQVLMFGGLASASSRLGDTWLWDGTNWTQANPANSPSPRDGAVMVFDAATSQVLLFGGTNGYNLNDTWVWSGTNWTQQTPTNSPSARSDYSMVYDAALGEVVLFGGYTDTQYANDTWVWNGTNWLQQAPANSPSTRYSQGMAYDAALSQVVMFGGYNAQTGTLNDTWLYDGNNWTQDTTASSPSARDIPNGMTYDPATNQVLLYGGFYGYQYNDTWNFGLPGNFGNVNVCPAGATAPSPCSSTVSFTYNVTAPVTFSAPQVVTQGTSGLDFTLNPGGTSCIGFLTGGTCTVSVTFAPLAPGYRLGSIQLSGIVDNNSTVVTNTPIQGVGEAPAVAIGPGTQATVNPTANYPLSQPKGVTLDAAGDVFIADNGNARVVKVAANGTVSTVGVGLEYPQGMAVDGAGDLFIADNLLNEVVEVPAGCASSGCQQIVGSGLRSQLGVAVDGAGDVFIGDFLDHEVVEVAANGGAQAVVYSPGTGSNPVGLAVDGAGDLFVADFGLAQVVEVPAGCAAASCQIQIGSGWVQPESVAVDAAGDVFVADESLNEIVEVPAGCASSSCQIVAVAGIHSYGVAIDGTGDLFIADLTNNQVVEVNRSQAPALTFPNTAVGSPSAPQSVTLQNIGNQPLSAQTPGLILVAGPNFVNVAGTGTPIDCSASSIIAPGGTCNVSVTFLPHGQGTYDSVAVFHDNALNAAPGVQVVNLSGAGASSSYALGVTEIGSGSGTVTDSLGIISCVEANGVSTGACSGNFAAGSQITLTAQASGTSKFLGWGGSCASSGTSATCNVIVTQAANVSASFVNQNFGGVSACPAGSSGTLICSHSLPVTFNLAATTAIGAIQVVTQGITGLDFTLGTGSTCVGTVAGRNSCNVIVNFAPSAPGLRLGAVQLFDSNANLVASTPIYGVGQQPAIAFGPGSPVTVPLTGLSANPQGIAVDAAGDVFVADYLNNSVVKINPAGTQTTVTATGLSGPWGIAVDGAGDLFISNNLSSQVVEVTPLGVQTTVAALGNSLSQPRGIAVDGAGNLFVADTGNARVLEVPANGGPQIALGTGLLAPVALALDQNGHLFIADSSLNQVVELANGAQFPVSSNLTNPTAIAVDAAGDLFIADGSRDTVVEITPLGVANLVASGIQPDALALDPFGNVYISNQNATSYQVVKISRSQPPALAFALTNAGSTSADSPRALIVQNVGNQPLTGSFALNLGVNFTQTAATDCAVSFPLAPSAICSESFSFTPQTASYSNGSAVFTDNSLNSSPLAAQTIGLIGTGATSGQAALVAVPNVVGQTQAAAATPITGVGLSMGSVTAAASLTVPTGSIISQNPAAGTQVSVGSVVNLLVSTGLPQPPSPNPLLLENNYFLTGDYVSAGVTLHGTGVNGIATGTITIPGYSPVTPQGIPAGADVVDAFLYWESVENTVYPSSNSATFNNYSVFGQQIGSDIPNYKDGALTGTIRAYKASVNAYLPVGAGGIRTVSGNYTVSLPDSGGSTLPLTQGASLVLVYRVLSPNFPLKSVVIYDGSALPAGSTLQVVKGFYDATGGASGTATNTTLFAQNGAWNNSTNPVTLGQSNQYNATLNAPGAYAAVILSTLVNNSDNDGILDAWKAGPTGSDFHAGQPGYYDVKTGAWVGLPGSKHGQKDLFVQLDYMCGGVLANGTCDPTQENLFPSPDANGNDPLAMVQQAFAASGVQLHLTIGNAVPESTCVDDLTKTPAALCQFPNQPGVIGWKNSLEFSKLYPRNLQACINGGDCTTRFPYGQKDSYHYVLFGHSLAIPAWNTRFGSLTSINVVSGVTTITTADRGTGINACPGRITLGGVIGSPGLNGVYNTTLPCPDTKTIVIATPGVPNWSYPNNNLPEPVIGLTSGTITSISGYSDLGGADSAVTLGLWLTYPNQDMSKRANVIAGTLFHEIGHTLGLGHGGIYYDTPGSYVPTFEGNCKPNYQSVMNYLFQLDLVGPNQALAFSNQALNTINENTAGSVLQLTDGSGSPATFPTSAWYVPYTPGSTASPATRHCDGTPLIGDSAYRVDAPIAPIAPPWSSPQDLSFTGVLQPSERGFNDLANMDLRQVGATGGEFASLASVLTFGSSVAPLNIGAGGTVTLGSGGTIALGSGGTVALGSGGNVTLGSGGTITLGSGGNVTLGSGGNVTLGSGGTIALGSGGNVTLGSGGNVTLGSGGTITLGSGGTITLGSGGNVTLGSSGTIALGSGGTVTIPSSGGSYPIDGNGGTITLGSGGNVTLGSGGTVAVGAGGNVTLGSGGTVTLGSGGNVTLGSGGTVALGSGGTVTLGSGGNVTLGSGGTIALGSGGTVTLGSGGNVTLGSGGTVTLGSGGTASAGNVTLGSGGQASIGAGGTVTLGSGGTVTLGSGGNVTLGSGGTIALGSGGTIALGSGGNVTLGSGGTIALGSGGTITLGSGGIVTLGSGGTLTVGGVSSPVSAGVVAVAAGGTITLGSGGNVTLGSGGNVTLGSGGTVTLGSGGNVTLGSGGNVTLGSGGTITLGSGGTVTLGSGGNVTLGSGGVVTLGSGGSVTLGSGSAIDLASVPTSTSGSGGPVTNELTYETANSVVRPPASPSETITPAGVRITWKAPSFGVVLTYTIYRSSNGAAPLVIGSVSGVNGNPPATQFTDTNPDLTSHTVVYTIGTTLVPDTAGAASRTSQPSAPAVVKYDQTIALGPLPGSVVITAPPAVTATAMSSGTPNGLPVLFTAAGSCSIVSQSLAGTLSSATLALNTTGSCTITASQPGSNGFNAANAVSGTLMVLPKGSATLSQTINFNTLPNAQYGGSFSPVATSSAGLPISFSASGPCTIGGTISGAGKCAITASAPATATYSAASLTQTFTVYPAVLTVTANSLSSVYGQSIPSLTYSYGGFVLGDTASVISGMPALSTIATAASNAGSYPITVSTGTLATPNYSFLYVNGSLTLAQATQAISFTTNPPTTAAFGSSFSVAATGGTSGNAIAFTSSGACSNAGAVYTMSSGTGTCSVIAGQAGNLNYAAATPVTRAVTATLAPQTITLTTNPPASAAYNSTFTVAANSTSGAAVSFASAGACGNSGAVYTMTSGTGTCSVIVSQAGNANYAAATPVTKTVGAVLLAPTVTFTGAPASAAYHAVFTVATKSNASTSAIVTSSGACTNAGSIVTMTTGTGTCSLTATWAADTRYSGVMATQATIATRLIPSVTFTGAPASAAFHTLFTVGTTTTASSPALIASSGACTNTGTAVTMTSGTGTCSLTATWAADSNYGAATAAQSTLATLAPQAITFTLSSPASAAFASSFSVAAAGGLSGNPVTFTSAGVCRNSGAVFTLTNSIGTCSVIANQLGNANYAAAAPVTQTVTATGPSLTASVSSINFGTVYLASISARNIIVTNTGNAPATINDPILSIVQGGNSNEFIAVNLCPRPLAAGKSCTITIAFIAGPFYTPRSATLQIMSNAPGSPQPVTLTASVINPVLSLNPTSLSFGTIKHATSSTQNVTLTNTGTTPLNLIGLSVTGTNAANFLKTSNCGTSLAVKASCTVAVKFTPPTTGTFNATLTVVDNARNGTQTLPLSGTGN